MEKIARLILALLLIVAFCGHIVISWLDEKIEQFFGSDDDWNGFA